MPVPGAKVGGYLPRVAEQKKGGRMTKESEDQAFEEGWDAADRGLSDTANPYPSPSDEHLSWNDGYGACEGEE